MTTIEEFVRDERVNALVGWLAVLTALSVAGWRAVAGATLAPVLTLGCVLAVVAPAVVRCDPFAMLPWELVVVLVGFLLARAASVAVPLSGYGAVAALALAVAVDIDVLTPVDMTPSFSVGFVVVTTMAIAGLWGIARYTIDVVAGTTHLASNADLMWDLLAATVVGVAAGLLFEVYLRRVGQLTIPSPSDPGDESTRQDRVPLDDSRLRYVVRGMQVVLFVMTAYGVATLDLVVVSNAGIALGVTLVPAVVGRRYGRSISAGLALWITAAAFLHAVGLLGPYGSVGWYDQVTHTLSASVVAGVGYAIVRAVDHWSTSITFTPAFRLVCVVLFVLAAGVCWELIEFGAGGAASILGHEAVLVQYGLRDTVSDLVFDAVGALVVALWGTSYADDIANLLSASLRAAD